MDPEDANRRIEDLHKKVSAIRDTQRETDDAIARIASRKHSARAAGRCRLFRILEAHLVHQSMVRGLAVAAVAGALWWGADRVFMQRMREAEAAVDRIAALVQGLGEPYDMVTTWRDADGLTHTVTTPRNDGESEAAWAARHQAAVKALQALFPPG